MEAEDRLSESLRNVRLEDTDEEYILLVQEEY